jgi:hypothetical protein
MLSSWTLAQFHHNQGRAFAVRSKVGSAVKTETYGGIAADCVGVWMVAKIGIAAIKVGRGL